MMSYDRMNDDKDGCCPSSFVCCVTVIGGIAVGLLIGYALSEGDCKVSGLPSNIATIPGVAVAPFANLTMTEGCAITTSNLITVAVTATVRNVTIWAGEAMDLFLQLQFCKQLLNISLDGTASTAICGHSAQSLSDAAGVLATVNDARVLTPVWFRGDVDLTLAGTNPGSSGASAVAIPGFSAVTTVSVDLAAAEIPDVHAGSVISDVTETVAAGARSTAHWLRSWVSSTPENTGPEPSPSSLRRD